jgi:5-methylthioadenosine/S-adenosylhomocysteine deaminase
MQTILKGCYNKMTKTLITNGTFVTMDDQLPVIVNGAMMMDDDRITYIGLYNEELRQQAETIIDGTGKCYLPGFVNTHGHAAMSLLRGYADDLNLQVWLEQKMWPMEGKFTKEDVRAGTMLSIAEMIRSGTTSFVDMYDKMDEVGAAVDQTGMRACLTRGIIGFPVELQPSKLKEAKEFAKSWHGAAEGRITTMMSPHAPYTCPPDFITQVVEAATELNLPIHTHMSESLKEVEQNVQYYGVRPVEHLLKLGVFSRPCLLAHAVHLTDEEIAILASHHVHVSHNPGSNLKLASGIARLVQLRQAGVLVSLGTDSSASNNNLDMFEEIRLTALLHKGVTGDPTAIPALDALKMGTIDGARSIWLDQVGMLRAGYKADFIAVDMNQPHFVPRTDMVSHLVYSASGADVIDVCINGRWVMRKKELLTLDIERVMFDAEKSFQGLLDS